MENSVTDKELVLNTINGSGLGFEQIIKRYSPKLYLFIFNRTGNREDTEDIVQETFLKVYKNLSGYDPKWKFSTWIYTIAARTVASHFRYMDVRNRKPMIEIAIPPTPEEELLKDDINNIWTAARKLDRIKFELLWLRYREGMTLKEIGKIAGKSPVNTRVILHRAKSELAGILNTSGDIRNAIKRGPEKNLT